MSETQGNTENVRYLIPPQTPKLLWAVICLLALVVAGQGWYIHQVDLRAAASTNTVAGQASLDDVKTRLDALETNQHDWSRHAIALDARFDALQTNQKDWNRHVMTIDTRADHDEQVARTQLARLQKELAGSRHEASLRTEAARTEAATSTR
jgi:hypothetical protein